MDELKKTMPDDFWRKAFDEASETPPPRVWDAIEHRLNESNGTRIIPLWGAGLSSSRPLAWSVGIAASLTLVLVGWWLMPTSQKSEPLAIVHPKVQTQQATSPTTSTLPRSSANSSMATNQATAMKSGERNATIPGISNQSPSAEPALTVQPTGSLAQLHKTPADMLPNNSRNELDKTALAGELASTNQRSVAAAFMPSGSTSTDVLSQPMDATTLVMPVSGKTFRTGRFGQIHRIVWFRPAELPIAPEKEKSKRKTRDVWASATVMSAAFNPMVALRTTTYASNYVSYDALRANGSSNEPSVSSRPNFSLAYQANAGVQLTDHWSLESGVGYLVGRSTVETPSQLPAASLLTFTTRSAANTQYTDALRSSISNANLAYSAMPATNTAAYTAISPTYIGQQTQLLTNDYQYVQVPVQVGYQLRPRKKLSLALLGGFITNIFVKNTVGNEVVVTAKDGVYRPVSLAATVGARFRYRPSQQWSASVAGMYQPSLGLGTQPESQVQTRPTSAGMSFGVDYHF